MDSRFGVRTALTAIAVMGATAAPVAASTSALRPRVLPSGASTPKVPAARVLLPGDAEAAGVRADPHNWLISARPGFDATAIAHRFGAHAIGSRQIGAFVVGRERARSLADALRARSLLVSASPNVLRQRFQAPPGADPLTPQQWWRNAVVAPTTPTPPVLPTSPMLGLADSMPDMTHPEWAGGNFATLGTQAPETAIGHGTATGSVASAPVNGVGIIGIWPGMRALNAALPPEAISCADSVAQIGNLINAGVAVINMSYGSTSFCPQEFAELEFAVARGVIPVASAGNELQEGNPPEFPASLPHVLTIAAVTQAGGPAPFSNANAGVDLGAPGTGVLAAVPLASDTTDGTQDGYELLDGTSFSSPIVAAATTWVRAVRTDLTPDQVAQVMRVSAVDIAPAGWDIQTGFGMLNIDRALATAPPPPDPGEPNEDIVFIDGSIIKPRQKAIFGGRKTVRGIGLLDAIEDPDDVYRITLPAHRKVLVSVKPAFGDADVSVYKGSAKSITQRSRILGKSGHAGSKTDAVTIRNRKGQTFAYVRVFVHPKATTLNAAYLITVKRR
jgi:subtilase family protein